MAKFELTLKHSRVTDGGVTAPRGFKAAGIHSGMRRNKSKLDLAMLRCDVRCAAAAAYTQNLVKGGICQTDTHRALYATAATPTPAMPTGSRRLSRCVLLPPAR